MPESGVEIAAHDPDWARAAAQAIMEIRAALHPLLAEIEHIGSTAIPGLATKPIIDVMGATGDVGAVAARGGDLARLGFEPHSNGMTGRLLYVRSVGHRRTGRSDQISAALWSASAVTSVR